MFQKKSLKKMEEAKFNLSDLFITFGVEKCVDELWGEDDVYGAVTRYAGNMHLLFENGEEKEIGSFVCCLLDMYTPQGAAYDVLHSADADSGDLLCVAEEAMDYLENDFKEEMMVQDKILYFEKMMLDEEYRGKRLGRAFLPAIAAAVGKGRSIVAAICYPEGSEKDQNNELAKRKIKKFFESVSLFERGNDVWLGLLE